MKLVEFMCRSQHFEYPVSINPGYVVSVIPDNDQNGVKTEIRMFSNDQRGQQTTYKTVDDYATVVGKINEAMAK